MDIRMDTPDMLTERPHLCEGCGEPMLALDRDQAYCPDCRSEALDEDNPELEARLDRALDEL